MMDILHKRVAEVSYTLGDKYRNIEVNLHDDLPDSKQASSNRCTELL